uniref:Autophagy-related protein 14 n=1 Tax=Kalmanozyma brasiliensis (strain GHG001) TaxID=1365824 RepID=V5E4T7_KALBG
MPLHASSSSGKPSTHGAGEWKLVCQTRADLRDLEPLPGNLHDASLALPPNAILLGLAPGANSLSGRASLASSDSQHDSLSKTAGELKDGPKLTRKVSEREAERTRHILESIIYYAVPIKAVASEKDATIKGQRSATVQGKNTSGEQGQRAANPSRSPRLQRRVSREGYTSDPEKATSRKAVVPRIPEQSVAPPTSLSGQATSALPAIPITPDARRRERRKAFEDEQKRVLELSLRETKMMPSYDLDQAKKIAMKQAELEDLLDEVEELRQHGGQTLADPKGFVQLRLKREQQRARYEAVKGMAIDESNLLEQRRAELAQRRAALEARQKAMQASVSLFETAEARSRQLGEEARVLTSEKVQSALQLHAQQASLLRDLETIFPIELSDATSLLYSVCGLPLPNAVSSLPQTELLHEEKRWKETVKRHHPASSRPVFHAFDDDTVSSALGLVAQLVVLLSTYLATPIHYPLATAGSRAVVQDGISLMSGPRAFPLYAKGMERYRYEYAAFLLNKDIEQLMNVHSVTVIDIRHTLPNLKNLMVTVAAAPPTSQLTRKSHIGKTEIALRSVKSSLSLSTQDEEETSNGHVKKGGLAIGLGLPTLSRVPPVDGKQGKSEVAPDTLVTTRVLGAPAAATATPATASGAIASVSRAFSYFSGGTR